MTQIRKTLYFVPDRPGILPRIGGVLQGAKGLADARRGRPGQKTGQKIPVFSLHNQVRSAAGEQVVRIRIVEEMGIRTRQFRVPGEVEVVNVEDNGIRAVFDAAVLYSCIMTHNACHWSQKHQDNQLVPEFMAELAAIGAMAAGREPSIDDSSQVYQKNLQEGYNRNIVMMENAGASFFGERWPSVQPMIDEECGQNLQSTKVNDGLIGLIQTEILAPLAGVMQDLVQKKVPAMGQFFANIANEIPQGNMGRNWLMDSVVARINDIIRAIGDFRSLGEAASNPILLNRSAFAISRSMSALNSLSYAYAVAGSDFGEGVMNVPWDGEATLGMINTLRATGIDVKPEE